MSAARSLSRQEPPRLWPLPGGQLWRRGAPRQGRELRHHRRAEDQKMMEAVGKKEVEPEQRLIVAVVQEAWHWPRQNRRRLQYQARQRSLVFRRARPQEAMLEWRNQRPLVHQKMARQAFFGIPTQVKSSPGMAVVGRVPGT